MYDVVGDGRASVEGNTRGEEREGEKQVDIGEEEREKWHIRAPLGERGRWGRGKVYASKDRRNFEEGMGDRTNGEWVRR